MIGGSSRDPRQISDEKQSCEQDLSKDNYLKEVTYIYNWITIKETRDFVMNPRTLSTFCNILQLVVVLQS